MWLKNTGFRKSPNHLRGRSVRVRFRDGEETTVYWRADVFRWSLAEMASDITEYKIQGVPGVD